MDAGDAHEHIIELYNSAKLWEVFEGEGEAVEA
jgi:hypothetical protein